MAVFNYSGSYSTISPYISSPTNTVAAADLLKIFISPDTSGGGHLITRGIDLIPTFASGKRGMVPAISSDVTTHYLRGDGWTSLWNQSDEDDAVVGGTQNAYLAGALVSAKDIKQWIAQSFVANDAMQFRGVITIGSSDITSSTTNPNGFPTSCKVGDTYKVSGDSTVSATYIAGQPVTTGDLVVCIKAGTGNSLNTDEYWTIVQNNVERLITVKVNGKYEKMYTPFIVVAGTVIDNNFKNVNITNGKIIDNGNKKMAIAMCFPGLQESLGISKDKIDIPNTIELTSSI